MLAELLRARAAEAGGDLAFIVDGGATLSFASWDRRSDAAAHGLSGRGVEAGNRVVLLFDTADFIELAVATAAVHKAGAVAVPLAAHASVVERERVVRHASATTVVGPEALARLERDGGPLGSYAAQAAAPDPGELSYRLRPLRPARPAAHQAEDVLGLLDDLDGETPPASMLHCSAVGTDLARWALWFPLRAGLCPVVIVTGADSDRIRAVTAAHKVARWALDPLLADLVLDTAEAEPADLSSLAQIVLAGGPVRPAVLTRVAASVPHAAILSVGSTADGETAGPVFVYDRTRPHALESRAGGPSARVAGDLGPVALVDDDLVHLTTGDHAAKVTDALRPDPAAADAANAEAGARPPRGPTVAPRTDVEESIAVIWRRVLGEAHVGVYDDFFELGGDEVAAVDMLALVEDAVGRTTRFSAFVADATVAGLAAALNDPGAVIEPTLFAPITTSQEGMVWQEQLVPGSQNLPPLARRYRGPLDVDALGRALTEIVRRHEPLRTTYAMAGTRPVQVVAPAQPVVLDVRDLSDRPAGEQANEVGDVLAEARRPMDLVAGPLFAPTVIRLAPDDHVVVFRVHHSAYDDWSVSVFRRELSALYRAFSAGEPAPLPDLPVSFSQFARGQRRRLAGAPGARQMAWWRTHLAGAPLALQLPVDDPGLAAGAPQASPEPVSVTVPDAVYAQLQALARRERATVFITALASFAALLRRYAGQPDLLLSAVVANRNRVELEDMVGCFTKKVLLPLHVDGEAPFAELVKRTRTALLGALSHQDLAFETVLQDALGPVAAASGVLPQPAVVFQGVTPPAGDPVLGGLTSEGFDTASTTRRGHFAAARDDGPAVDARPPWGAGMYLGTFVILSVGDDEALSFVARGAFWRPAMERLLADLSAVLADAVAHPSRPVTQLATTDDPQPQPASDEDLETDRTLNELFAAQVARDPSAPAISEGPRSLTFAELDARADAVAARLRSEGVRPGEYVGLALPPSADCVVGVLAAWKVGAGFVGLDPDDDPHHRSSVIDTRAIGVVLGPEAPRGVGRDGAAASPARPAPDSPALAFHGHGASAVTPGVVLSHRTVAGVLGGLRQAILEPATAAIGRTRLRVRLSAHPPDDGFVRQLVALLDGHTLVVGPGPVEVVDTPPEGLAALGADSPAVIVVGSRTPISRAERERAAAREGSVVHQVFGPPECGFAATAELAADGGPRLTIGRPLSHVTADVVDPSGTALPVQVPGELQLSRPGLARHATGLIAGRLPDGRLEVVGAAAAATVLRGLRIDRRRVEIALIRHPAVREVTVSVEGAEASDAHLVAQVVPEDGRRPSLAELRAHLWSELPGYAWPRRLVMALDGNAEASRDRRGLTLEERLLCGAWADILGVDTVRPDQNYWTRFSFLGAVARLREAGIRLSDAQVARNRTLHTLAADLAAERIRRKSDIWSLSGRENAV